MSSGGSQPDDSSVSRPVDHFYRVKFANERDFRLWNERVAEFTSALREILPNRTDIRPVVFVPLRPVAGAPIYAYVSPGARGLAADIADGATVDPTPIGAAELPRGLIMLFGEGVDAGEYVKRHV